MYLNKSGLIAYEDRYLHTVVECEKCKKELFEGCSLGLTVSDIKECPYCGNPIDVTVPWKNVEKKRRKK